MAYQCFQSRQTWLVECWECARHDQWIYTEQQIIIQNAADREHTGRGSRFMTCGVAGLIRSPKKMHQELLQHSGLARSFTSVCFFQVRRQLRHNYCNTALTVRYAYDGRSSRAPVEGYLTCKFIFSTGGPTCRFVDLPQSGLKGRTQRNAGMAASAKRGRFVQVIHHLAVVKETV